MDFRKFFLPGALALCLAAALCGCAPGQSQSDDEQEPHYVRGQSLVNAMDYQGAAEEFEESLEVNPRSAPAHYQLAMLFDSKVPDPAAAIYHYQEYLKLDPNAGNADVIRQRIYACKQQLAADVMPLPSSPAMAQQLEKLTEQNRQLQAQVDQLNNLVKQWSTYADQLAARTNPAQTPAPQQTQTPVQIVQQSQTPTSSDTGHTPVSTAARTHAVASGETEASIARRYGIELSVLQAANPGVDPRKLHVGQILKIPSP